MILQQTRRTRTLAGGHSLHIVLLIALVCALVAAAFRPHGATLIRQTALAAGAPCITDGPSSGAYTFQLCITAPADGTTVSGDTTVSATVTQVSGTMASIWGVQFGLQLVSRSDNPSLLTDFLTPYTFTMPTNRWVDGDYRLSAKVTFDDGFKSTVLATTMLTFENGVTSAPSSNGTWQPKTSNASPMTVVAVGDGAGGLPGAGQVGNLVNSLNPDLFLYLGDVYNAGTYTEMMNYYDPPFGSVAGITNPVPGNHETGDQWRGYFNYWNLNRHYYSYDAGGWHFIALDTNDTSSWQQTAAGTEQYNWLVQDLFDHRASTCTLVYFHQPRWGSSKTNNYTYLQDIWSLLELNGVDVVLNGHEHNYQRWVPMDDQGNPDPDGLSEYIVGTGGHELQPFGLADSRIAARYSTDGALKLQLGTDGGTTQFFDANGSLKDSSSFSCHDASSPVTPVPSPPPTQDQSGNYVYGAIADATVQEDNPSNNYGSSTSLRTDGDPTSWAYLKFSVYDLPGSVQSAKLRLWVTDGTSNAPPVSQVIDTNWPEMGISWNSRPATQNPVDDKGGVADSTWLEYDVTSLVSGNGTFSFALVPQWTDGLVVNSREASTAQPQLVITIVPGSTPPATATPTTPPPTATTPAATPVTPMATATTPAATTPASTPTIAPTTPTGTQTTLTYAPVADSQVSQASPDTNYGSSKILLEDGGGDPAVESYVRFDVTNATGVVTSAKLRLFVSTGPNSGSGDGPALYTSADTTWGEKTITWNNRPARTTTALGDLGPVAIGTWIEFDVSSVITGNGSYTFALATSSRDGTELQSRENINPPQLVVNVLSSGTPTSTVPPPTATVAPGTPTTTVVPATETATITPTATATVTTPPVTITPTTQPGTTQTFVPVADSQVSQASPDTNYGSSKILLEDGGGDPAVESYVRFDVSTVAKTVTSAKLRLFVSTGPNSGSSDGPALYTSADTTWGEKTITWNNRPARTTTALGDLGPVAIGTWIEYDVSPVITGNGTYTFVLATGSRDGTELQSRENANPPQLVLGVSGGQEQATPISTATPSPSSTASATGTPVVTTTVATSATPVAANATASATVSPSTTETRTYLPAADARVEEANPLSNFGSSTALWSDAGPGGAMESYVRFSVTDLPGAVQSAKVRFFVPTGTAAASNDAPALYTCDNNGWSEGGISWTSRPPRSTTSIADLGAVQSGTWVEYDVSPVIGGNGDYTFVLASTSNDGTDYASRETSTAPQLVITTAGATPAAQQPEPVTDPPLDGATETPVVDVSTATPTAPEATGTLTPPATTAATSTAALTVTVAASPVASATGTTVPATPPVTVTVAVTPMTAATPTIRAATPPASTVTPTPTSVSTVPPTATIAPATTAVTTPSPAAVATTPAIVPPQSTATTPPTAVATTSATSAASVEYGTVTNTNGDGVNCRVAPSTDAAIITVIPEGQQVQLNGPAQDGWQPVICENQAGFVLGQYITIDGTAPATVAPTAATVGTVAATNAPATVTPTEPATALPIVNGWNSANASDWRTAFDQDETTVWSAQPGAPPDQAVLGVDFGATVPIDQIRWESALSGDAGVVEVRLSDDGTTWYSLGTIELTNQVPGTWSAVTVDIKARYVKLVATNPTGVNTVGGFAEIQFAGDTAGVSQPLDTLGAPVEPVPTTVAATQPPAPPPVATDVSTATVPAPTAPVQTVAPTQPAGTPPPATDVAAFGDEDARRGT